jgi:uncharacterized protein (DUF1810 family)
MNDAYNLRRFVAAQDGVLDSVIEELTAGEKRGHWMWYIFPQIKGLGHSAVAQTFAISTRGEAEAYANHSILGPRLKICTQLVINVEERTIDEIFGHPDYLKFRSSMTLFMGLAPSKDTSIFKDALDKYFSGKPDELTLRILKTLCRESEL